MPDKRQQSKQRRAARNRANREALAARRENAEVSTSASSGGSSSGGSPSGASSGGRATSGASSKGSGARGWARPAAADAPPPEGIMGMLRNPRVGDIAVLVALLFAVVAAVVLLFYTVPADDRGEPLPSTFRAVSVEAREMLTGEPVPDESVTLREASGPEFFLVIALPVAVVAFAVWGNLRPNRSRMLTFAMLAMAGSVIFTAGIGIFYFPAMIALAVGGFRVRKAELPARTAGRATAPAGRRRGRVIDAESEDVTDDVADDEVADDEVDVVDDEVVDDGPEDDGAVDDDVLAELEAELEAEERDADDADDAGGDAGSGRRR